METKRDELPMLAKGIGGQRGNYSDWQDVADKHAKMNDNLYSYWRHGIIQEFPNPAYTVPQRDAAGLPVLNLAGNVVMVVAEEYREAQIGLILWKSDQSRVAQKKAKYLDEILPRFVSKILTSLGKDIENELVNVADYEARRTANDLAFLKTSIRFIATGAGGVSIALDALNLQREKIAGNRPEDLSDYIRRFRSAQTQLFSRNADMGVVLNAMLFSIFITNVRQAIPELEQKAKDALMLPVAEQNINAVTEVWSTYLTNVTTLVSGEDNYGAVKAHVSEAMAESAKAKIREARSVLEKEGQVLQSYMAQREETGDMMAMLGRAQYGNRKQSGGQSRTPQTYTPPPGTLCLKCGKPGHLYKDCTVLGTVKCQHKVNGQICGQAHATSMHEMVMILKQRAIDRGHTAKRPWQNTQGHISDTDADTPNTTADRDRMLDEAYDSMMACCGNDGEKKYDEYNDLDEMYVDAMHGSVMFRDDSPDNYCGSCK